MKKVIFVYDSKTVLVSVEMILEEMIETGKIELITYDDPTHLLEDIGSGVVDYDLLFTDMNMPQMNGLEVARILKQNDRVKQKPILALTTETSTEIKTAGKQIGLAGWVVKPFSDENIQMAVKKVLAI